MPISIKRGIDIIVKLLSELPVILSESRIKYINRMRNAEFKQKKEINVPLLVNPLSNFSIRLVITK